MSVFGIDMPIINTEKYMSKAFIAAFFLGVLVTFKAGAADVSILVVETGLLQEDGNKQHSLAWENVLLDACFEAGHIVTNAPLMRLTDKSTGDFPSEAAWVLEEAMEWGSDFFIIALLDYENGGKVPRETTIRLFRINQRQYVKTYEQKLPGRSFKTLNEEFDFLKITAQGLAAHLTGR
jgi:hypothetical protein